MSVAALPAQSSPTVSSFSLAKLSCVYFAEDWRTDLDLFGLCGPPGVNPEIFIRFIPRPVTESATKVPPERKGRMSDIPSFPSNYSFDY
jgi:hypothetical protein